MKRSLFFLCAVAAIAVACEKNNNQEGEVQDPNTVVYDGVTYKTVTLSNGQTWMAEPLRYLPEGKTADGNGIWNPYKVVDGAAVELTDAESIAKYGYLYDAATIFGAAIDVNNVTSFEGAQGICPDGWHIPTKAEWTGFCGYAQSATLSDGSKAEEILVETAPIYNADYKGGCVTNAQAADWNPVLSGCVISGKYNVLIVSTGEQSVGSLKMNYFAGSTGHTGSKGTSVQFWALMSTFQTTYPEGRLHVSFNNAPNGVQVRCIKNAK